MIYIGTVKKFLSTVNNEDQMPRQNHGHETITIAGHPFKAPVRYTEGHELTAGEASQLNQVLHENLRNNFAKKVKDAHEAGSLNLEAMQHEFDKYADEYEMGIRSGTGVTRDPVRSEALKIAKQIVRAAIKRKGKNPNDFEAAAIAAKANEFLDSGSAKATEVLDLAKKRVEEAQAAAGVDLGDLLGDMQQKPAAETAQAAE